MRHGNKNNKLGRKTAHRHALLSNLASSLIMHKRINTTLAKAKALRKYVEPLLTKSKTDSTHSRRIVFGLLQNKEAVAELFKDIAVKIASRPGGYTRILKTGFRPGDNAEMCMIELVDYNENMVKGPKKEQAEAKPKTRRGRSKAKAAPAAKATEAKAEGTEATEKPKKKATKKKDE